jgi:hypothetical protein
LGCGHVLQDKGQFPSFKAWKAMMKAYQDVAELHASSNNNNGEVGNVFFKEDWLHMTEVSERGTEARRSTVPRNQLLHVLLSVVKPSQVNPRSTPLLPPTTFTVASTPQPVHLEREEWTSARACSPRL